MTLYKCVNGEHIALTPEEEQEYEAMQQEFESAQPERIKKQYSDALADFVDNVARQKEYKDAVSCASYETSTNTQWSSEAQVFIAWRDVAFAYAYDYLNKVQLGEIANPDLDLFIAGIPEITWPEVPQQ